MRADSRVAGARVEFVAKRAGDADHVPLDAGGRAAWFRGFGHREASPAARLPRAPVNTRPRGTHRCVRRLNNMLRAPPSLRQAREFADSRRFAKAVALRRITALQHQEGPLRPGFHDLAHRDDGLSDRGVLLVLRQVIKEGLVDLQPVQS